MYVNIYRLAQFILDLHTHVCMHAHPRTCTPARKAHPARMLTFLFSQWGKTALELASNDEVKAAFVRSCWRHLRDAEGDNPVYEGTLDIKLYAAPPSKKDEAPPASKDAKAHILKRTLYRAFR